MRVLITGGAGFLGTALANRLAAEGHAVQVLDDLSSGDAAGLAAGLQFTRGDVRDVPRLWTLMAGVDLLYHLAAKVSVSESILYPVDYNAVNTGGTVAVMSAARDAGLRRVVFVSSGTVYGQPDVLPVPESARAQPLNPYAVSKLAAEHYVRAIGDQVRIETVILRVFNAFGPGQTLLPAHPPVVPHFLRQVRGGGSVVLHGSPPGAQTRDFIYVDDVVEALIRAGSMGGIGRRAVSRRGALVEPRRSRSDGALYRRWERDGRGSAGWTRLGGAGPGAADSSGTSHTGVPTAQLSAHSAHS